MMIHPSRVIRFIGSEYPGDQQKQHNAGWGDSILQSVNDAVRNAAMCQGGIAAVIDELKIDIVKIPGFTENVTTKAGEDAIISRLAFANVAKSSVNTLVLDSEEEWERVELNAAGMPDIMREFMVVASGAADIPVTRLLGQSPAGMNATGESDIRNYYDSVRDKQENEITPSLDRLDEILIRSALGSRDPNIYYEWNPLWQTDEETKAKVAYQKAQTYKIDVDTGLLPDVVLGEARANQLIEDGTYPGLDNLLEDFDFENFLGSPDEQIAAEEEQSQLELQSQQANIAATQMKALPPPAKKQDSWQRQMLDSFKRPAQREARKRARLRV